MKLTVSFPRKVASVAIVSGLIFAGLQVARAQIDTGAILGSVRETVRQVHLEVNIQQWVVVDFSLRLGQVTESASKVAQEVAAKSGHADDAGDLATIHSYAARVDGAPLQIVRGDVSGWHCYCLRLQQEDEMLAWSSPMFVNYK